MVPYGTQFCGYEQALTRTFLQSSVKNVFIRGSVVRYVHLPGSAVDTALLEDGWLMYVLIASLANENQ